MDDLISRQAAIDIAKELIITINGYEQHNQAVNNYFAEIMQLPPAQPEQHIDADGTLWITVPDIERVTRVIVDENKSKFCRQFYMDAQPQRTGKWIKGHCSECGDHAPYWAMSSVYYGSKFCPNCGVKMTEGDAE